MATIVNIDKANILTIDFETFQEAKVLPFTTFYPFAFKSVSGFCVVIKSKTNKQTIYYGGSTYKNPFYCATNAMDTIQNELQKYKLTRVVSASVASVASIVDGKE